MHSNTQKLRPRPSLLSRYNAEMGTCISRARSERALRAAAMDQKLANRVKSEFLANMSHELRTPLNAIIGFSDMIRLFGEKDTVKTCEYADMIQQAGRHLLDIISNILDISKIESGRFELNLEEIPLHEILTPCVNIVEARIAQKQQDLKLKLAPDLPNVWVDATRMKQVIINLLSNAHKFTPAGGRIVLAAAPTANSMVSIVVQDTGIGMSGEQIAVALTPFGQIRNGYTRTHEGTGLGLPIAKALVEQHHGRFYINSVENGGTAVVFSLPLNPAQGGNLSSLKEHSV